MLGLHFVESGKITREAGRFYSDLFNQRHKGDYDAFVVFETDKVEEMLKTGREFVKEIKILINPA